ERLQADGTKKALAVYQKALPAAEGDWMIRMNFAQLLMDCDDLPAAYEQYQQALTYLRHNFVALSRIGKLELTLGLASQSAERHFRAALRLAPEDIESAIGLAEALERQGNNKEAEAVFEKQAQKNSPAAFAVRAFGRFLYRHGRLEDAK